MNITYKNYSILKRINEGILSKYGDYPIVEKDLEIFHKQPMIDNYLRNVWYESISDFKSEILFVSNSFKRNVDLHEKSLIKLIQSIDNLTVKGVFMYNNFIICADIKLENHELVKENLLCFHKNEAPIIVSTIDYDTKNGFKWISSVFDEENSNKNSFNYNHIEKITNGFLAEVCFFYLMKSYAQVETKELKPKQKLRDISCKYMNNTNMNITYLDSKWFTNLVKSDGFNVRGHFRLQPKKKEGVWTKELIWINDFQKTGYTAPAKILSNQQS